MVYIDWKMFPSLYKIREIYTYVAIAVDDGKQSRDSNARAVTDISVCLTLESVSGLFSISPPPPLQRASLWVLIRLLVSSNQICHLVLKNGDWAVRFNASACKERGTYICIYMYIVLPFKSYSLSADFHGTNIDDVLVWLITCTICFMIVSETPFVKGRREIIPY